MAHLKIYVCSLLLILTCYKIQVNALLNITEEALKLSRQLRSEVQDNKRYSDKKEVAEKVEYLKRMFLPYLDMLNNFSDHFFVDYLYLYNSGCMSSKIYSLFSSVETNARVNIDIMKDNLKYYKPLDNGEPFSLISYIRENDYNLTLSDNKLETLDWLHQAPVEIDELCKFSLLDYAQNQTKICKHQSHQQTLYNYIKSIAFTEATFFSAIQYSYATYKVLSDAYDLLNSELQESLETLTVLWKEKDFVKKMIKQEENLISRNRKTLMTFKSAMKNSPLRKIVCEKNMYNRQEKYDEGEAYTKLETVFQKYVLNEADLDDSSCTSTCPDYRKSKVYGCYDMQICKLQPKCHGTIWDCGNDIASVKMCAEVDEDRYKYSYMKLDDQEYGETHHRCHDYNLDLQSWTRGFVKCSYCLCTCEQSSPNSNVYFNLRPVLADVRSNHIVTGLKFQKANHVIHLQIQEGELLANGEVSSAKWRAVDNYTVTDPQVVAKRDYHKISWENGRTLYLDALRKPNDYVVTGVRFNLVENNLRLEIHATEFDFNTGKLLDGSGLWIYNNVGLRDRAEVNLEHLKENQTTLDNANLYVKFTSSPIELDAGQSTVPNLEIIPLATIRSTPLSGAGLFIKNVKNAGPTLALQLFTYDFVLDLNI